MSAAASRIWRAARATLLAAAAIALIGVVFLRAGVTRGIAEDVRRRLAGEAPRRVLRVWDWWAPSTNEQYAAYFTDIEQSFERLHPDVDVQFQFVPFGQYEQKMATGLVGNDPPDVFQSSVSWAEGFYDRGMLLELNAFLDRERREREQRQRMGRPIDTGQIVDREAFHEAGWRHNTKLDGTVFGIPQILDASCLMWNLEILREAAPDDAEIRAMFAAKDDGAIDWDRLRFDALPDWEAFRRVVKKLTVSGPDGRPALDAAGEPEQAGFAIHAHGSGAGPIVPWLAANGGNFQDLAGTRSTFANDQGLQAVQFLLDLYWKDRVTPPFRRQMSDYEVFEQKRVAAIVAGTWSGKYVVRDTEGWQEFSFTPFPPGPLGDRPTTVTWGNMLCVSRRTEDPELAWEYLKFVASLSGARRLLHHIEQNSPRRDFYAGQAWAAATQKRPYLTNVPFICASGKKRHNTQINAIDHAVNPVFESILLRYPEIERGEGPFPSVTAGLQIAGAAADRVYDRYNAQVAYWREHGQVAP